MFSSDPFQRLTAGGTFNRTFKIFAQRYDLFLIISGFVFIPLVAIMITVFQNVGFSMHTMMDGMVSQQNTTFYNNFDDVVLFSTDAPSSQYLGAGGSENMDQEGGATQVNNLSWQFVIEYVVFICFAFGGKAAMAHAVAELYAGRDPSWFDCCKKGFQRWCDIFLAVMLMCLVVFGCQVVVNILFLLAVITQVRIIVFLGFLLMMAWMVCYLFALVSLSLLAPVIMVESSGPVQAIKRCWELSWNNRCYIFCTIYCFSVMYYVVQLLFYVVLASAGGVDFVFSALGAFLIMLPVWIYLPLAIIAETVVYINIRVQQEGLDKGVLEGDLDGDSSITKSKYSIVDRGGLDMEVV